MTLEQTTLFAILGATLGLLVWGRLRYDVVAVLALLAAVLLGLVPTEQAFVGFGHPAVVTVAAVLVLSRALRGSGLIEGVARRLHRISARPSGQILAVTGLTAALSAFMNNVGATALMLPVAIRSALDAGRSPSQLLMPLSFASLLGGLITLVGTPPNIIIANARAEHTGKAFGMFDFSPVGLAVAVTGLLFVALIGWRLLPLRVEAKQRMSELFHIEDYTTEVQLPKGSAFVGKRIAELETAARGDVAVVALIRREDRMLAPSGYLRLLAGDILVLEADTESLNRLVDQAELTLVGAAPMEAKDLGSDRVGVVEAVVMPGSRLDGRTPRGLRLHSHYGLNLLGVARQGRTIGERLGRVRFQAGDVLLLQGEREEMPETFAALGCLPLAERGIGFGRRRFKAAVPLAFGGAVALVVLGLLPPQIAFVLGVLALVLAGELGPREVYEAIDWPIIVLLGALIPVGMALETTGGSATIAAPLLALGDSVPLVVPIALLMIVTMLLSDIMNNAATAVLMAPIGVTLAEGLGVSIDPFLMAVAIGASSTYLTPIGHQSNLLIMGPGGYRFGDYWRMGLPLDVLIVAVAAPLILVVWPA